MVAQLGLLRLDEFHLQGGIKPQELQIKVQPRWSLESI